MSPASLRKALRWGHIAGAAVLGTYLYSPYSANPTFSAITLYVVFPLMTLGGVAMWQQARVNRLLRKS